MRPYQVWGCLLHALSVVVTTSIFTETQHDKHERIADTLSTTVWDVWQEHMRKGDQSIDAPATSFGVIPYSPSRKEKFVLL